MVGIHCVRSVTRFLSRLRIDRPPPLPSRYCRPIASSAAAAVQPAYWTDLEEQDEEASGQSAACVTSMDVWEQWRSRGVQWVFMGRPGAQKHVYATRLAELLDVPYITVGTLVRQDLHPLSSLYKRIANAVNDGRLVPEDIIFGLLSKRLEEGWERGETGFILDGIPRTKVQAEILDQITEVDLVVNFKSSKEFLVKRPLGSGICSHCCKTFDASSSESTSLNPCLDARSRHAPLKPSPAIDMKDDQIIKFPFFAEQSKQLSEYYRKQQKLLDFQVSDSPGETWKGLLAALHLQHMDTTSSLPKLTT